LADEGSDISFLVRLRRPSQKDQNRCLGERAIAQRKCDPVVGRARGSRSRPQARKLLQLSF